MVGVFAQGGATQGWKHKDALPATKLLPHPCSVSIVPSTFHPAVMPLRRPCIAATTAALIPMGCGGGSSSVAAEPTIQNPWQDPMGYVSGYGRPAGSIAYWGNGDGRFLYPPNRDAGQDKREFIEGPVSSIRWEMLREGLEDYEYFWLLRDRIGCI